MTTENEGSITDSAPLKGYGVRACRGHWHVVAHDFWPEGGDEDLSIPGDPFKTMEAAMDAADRLNRGDDFDQVPPLKLKPSVNADTARLDWLERWGSVDGYGVGEVEIDARYVDKGLVSIRLQRGGCEAFTGDSLRAAIDAAMTADSELSAAPLVHGPGDR